MGRTDRAIPGGAVAVVALGLLLSGAAALLSVGENEGGAYLQWDERAAIADSRQVSAGHLAARIVAPEIESTRSNASGYRLFRISGILRLVTSDRADRVTADCTVLVPERAVLGRTPGKRASYPLPSEDLSAQIVPTGSVVRFGAKGTDLVNVPLDDAIAKYTNAPGVKVDWAPYRTGRHTWVWVLTPVERPMRVVRLAFATLWRTTARPGGVIRCVADEGNRRVRVTAAGRP
ncbi:MAG: hypothetical protein U0R52_02245 [Solirubrobacterales bacterium]